MTGAGCSFFEIALEDLPRIEELVLVDSKTGRDLMALRDGDTVYLAQLPSRNLNVRAVVNGPGLHGVIFSYDRFPRYRVETVAPYALAGDKNGKFERWRPSRGEHTIIARLDVKPEAPNQTPPPFVVHFNVADSSPVIASSRVTKEELRDQNLAKSSKRANSAKTVNPSVTPAPSIESEEADTIVEEDAAPVEPLEEQPESVTVPGSLAENAPPVLQSLPTPPICATPNGKETHLRINSGGKQLVDMSGAVWLSDCGLTSASIFGDTDSVDDIAGTAVYLSGRSAANKPLTYHIPVPPGSYTLVFHFMELYLNESGKRVFDVIAEGQPVLENIDVYAVVGFGKPLELRNTITVSDGALDLSFRAQIGFAILNGLEVIAQ